MFYVVSDGIRTEHRGWELNAFMIIFVHVEVTPENVKVTRGFYF